MKRSYSAPSIDVHKYAIPYNSIFTSGDKLDDDVYDITVNANGNVDNDVFGD